jgi:hypothetical protein
MVIEGIRNETSEDDEPVRRHGFWLLVTTAIAASGPAPAGTGLRQIPTCPLTGSVFSLCEGGTRLPLHTH